MSGNSYDQECPRCGGELQCYSDHKPIDSTSGECLNCGLSYYTKVEFLSLKAVNALRADLRSDDDDPDDYPPLKELSKPLAIWKSSGYEPKKEKK